MAEKKVINSYYFFKGVGASTTFIHPHHFIDTAVPSIADTRSQTIHLKKPKAHNYASVFIEDII